MSKFNSSQGTEKIKEILSRKGAVVHFVGVGGISMYSLFNLTRLRGIEVSGSDKNHSERTEKLIKQGFNVAVPNNIQAVERAALVVYSLAVFERDEELRLAEELGIPLVSRAEYLSFILLEYETKISVSGSHGKSSVTAMLTKILSDAGKYPSAICGAKLSERAEPYISASRDYIVFEACEYKDSFLAFAPDIAVFLNLELDHTDYFKSFDDISRSFFCAMKKSCVCVVNKDDEALYSLGEACGKELVSYGVENNADFKAVNLKNEGGKYSFSVEKEGSAIAEVALSVLGKFSVYNALAAFAAAFSLGISPGVIAKSLSGFSGIERRLQIIAQRKDASPIVYDYAHHPSEIKSSILAVRDYYKGKINVIFKPHTYTRTRDLFDEFAIALSLADRVFLAEIDAVREEKIDGVSSENLARAIGEGAISLPEHEILEKIRECDGAVIIMGAANLDEIKEKIMANNL